jgi:glycosyltransferase involved in cell wall biosynthesis
VNRPLRVLAVGQTPPPLGGQAIAIESFVRGRYENLRVSHVRMAFSEQMSQIGKADPRKVLHLVGLVARILWQRMRTRADVLYYPPAGPDAVPVLRDLVVLLATRWAFAHTAFHFHAGGLCEIYPRLPLPLRWAFRRAYGSPDLAISPSDLNPPDGTFLRARHVVVVPNGVPRLEIDPARRARAELPSVPILLYVGVLRESKGLLVLVEACRELAGRGLRFELHLVGAPESSEFERRLQDAVSTAGLGPRTRFLGTLTGGDKARAFLAATVFCYPSYFESETFGLVLLEAMQCGVPVVATRWRGIPSTVRDGDTGLLVPVHDAGALADAVASLLDDGERACAMGERGRELFEASYTEERFRERMESALLRTRQ